MAGDKHHNLNILFLKDEYESAEQAIKDDHKIKRHQIDHDGKHIGTLHVKRSTDEPPKWTTFFKPKIDPYQIGVNKNVSAALLIETDKKKFAITFGQGRYLLKPDSWVERFGLIVALNSIGKQKIRTISKSTFDAISRQTKEQASKETDATEFGLDIEQDLLRAVTGSPKDQSIGKRIYGMDSLSVSTKAKIWDLPELLGKIHLKYLDNSYKIDFPWVDHISEVKDKTVIARLDQDLIARIRENKTDRIWMAVPEFIDWDKVDGFCYSYSKSDPICPDIILTEFTDFLKKKCGGNDMCVDNFKKRYVKCVHTEGYVTQEWQAYKCLYGELEKDQQTYVLSGGKWYLVEREFVKSVNKAWREIHEYTGTLPIYDDECEDQYNKRVADIMPEQYALMHNKKIPLGPGSTPIEFCDLYSNQKDIIHVKHYGNSSHLSHFFAQGRSSAEAFKIEENFRKKVAEKLVDGFTMEDPKETPKGDEYQIVYAIISGAPGDLDIPFFSRLNMKNSAKNLGALGYRVAKAKIEMSPRTAKRHKYNKRSKKKPGKNKGE